MIRLQSGVFWILVLWGAGAFVYPSVVRAREALVTTTDGRTFEGQVVVEDESGVTLMMLGIKVPIPRSQISNIQYKQTIEQQYSQRRAQLADDDVDGRYLLAYWLFESQAYRLAKQELDVLGRDFPGDSRVDRLSTIVTAHINQLEQPPQSPSVTTPPAVTQPLGADKQESKGKLTAEQINVIKIYEIDLTTEPKVVVASDVIDKILTQYADHPGVPQRRREKIKFRNAPGYKQLRLLFELRARELYGQVRVKGDPPALREFRSRIHQRYVLNYCGTVDCHGRSDDKGLTLLRDLPNSELTVYTNFFRLHSTFVSNQDVINRQQPRRSLLLQYGLARAATAAPHPEVPGWHPRFQDDQDKFFQDIESWIGSLWKPTPDYGIARQRDQEFDIERLP